VFFREVREQSVSYDSLGPSDYYLKGYDFYGLLMQPNNTWYTTLVVSVRIKEYSWFWIHKDIFLIGLDLLLQYTNVLKGFRDFVWSNNNREIKKKIKQQLK
jgi:hypothetical protein